ncbi:hypothetical protein AMIS_13340 [Actinoplanes missouriensis 431]|uniref:Uncharacterized protein n=1 Tax=Actinoplanes missouriensis (strain ATCC 14538 / DSM 43046 / CBS 188.64 / JCM 3121 / NBRC 102363 / NCIMB 12654 / NRRL B-3342 / UNCC 431) TaxID=512565 RepID=I0H0L7_ACTM4|nr:hypothetical protein [Actinoplanes missouriensis]BAL86554.1 hypothetical protein AMIS_13340 [Actinoplanes missouriensis 431]
MPKLIVEVHVPLLPAPDVVPGEYPLPWIDDVEDFLADLDEEADGAEDYDDGEEYGDVYVFFLTGTDEASVLRAASRLATLDRVPAGSFAMVTDDDAPEFGLGRRVELPLS